MASKKLVPTNDLEHWIFRRQLTIGAVKRLKPATSLFTNPGDLKTAELTWAAIESAKRTSQQ
jgi:hypothetical protein